MCIFKTFYPHPQNYELIDVYDALPHQRIVISPNTRNEDFMGNNFIKSILILTLKSSYR